MGELGQRSRSQILRGFLPQQTQDLQGGIYRVTEWSGAIPLQVDDRALRRHLLREIRPFEVAGNDGGVAADLRANARLEVIELDDGRGVSVEKFPQVWLCHSCKRIGKRVDTKCKCGQKRWGQLHFIGFHHCGAVAEPWIRRCQAHDDVQLISPRSAKATDIRFVCPTCKVETMRGLGFNRTCPGCQQGNLIWNVHKARSAYTPRGTVLVNPPRPEQLQELLAGGGARRTLDWVVEGMTAKNPKEFGGKPSKLALIQNLVSQGLDHAFAETVADQADASGQLRDDSDGESAAIPDGRVEAAEFDAVEIAVALGDSRITHDDLDTSHQPDGYAEDYAYGLTRTGFAAVDLVEQFPVLSVMYGYTRGGNDPSESRLVPFRNPRGGYRLHGELSNTEAMFIRLDPVRVAAWLGRRGHHLGGDLSTPQGARLAILAGADIPEAGDPVTVPTVGSDIMTLVHTLSHRVIRQMAAYAGIDRDALSEYLMPRHLGFFVYAAARGDFVLGGLQAVYESDMPLMLRALYASESRCPLDPGCSRGSGACSACLHLGEPSCRAFNTMLDRRALFGSDGFWTVQAGG
jgi:hypothetical protein